MNEKEYFILKRIVVIALIFITAGYGITLMSFGTTVHESIHKVFLKIFGCKEVVSYVNVAVGGTMFSSKACYLTREKHILVALLAPITVFIIGYWLWWRKGAEDSYIRVLAMLLMFISSVPSMIPNTVGTDFYEAVKLGFNPIAAWIIFLVSVGLMFHSITDEIIDKEMYSNILRKLKHT